MIGWLEVVLRLKAFRGVMLMLELGVRVLVVFLLLLELKAMECDETVQAGVFVSQGLRDPEA